MSSWACEKGGWDTNCVSTPNSSFTHPITISIYSDSGTLLAAKEQVFTIPYRPSANPECAKPTQWKASNGSCYSGFAFPISFDLHALNFTLPETFTYVVSFNTSTYGAVPLGTTGGYDSLNVGVYALPATGLPSVGSETQPGHLLLNGASSNEGYAMMAKFFVTAP